MTIIRLLVEFYFYIPMINYIEDCFQKMLSDKVNMILWKQSDQ